MTHRFFVVCLVAAFLCLPHLRQPLSAQFTTASLNGLIVDPSGAAVPGAKVSIRNTETGFNLTTTTGDTGLYLFPRLPVGSYTLTAERAVFPHTSRKGSTWL
jgi:hypothetical protein